MKLENESITEHDYNKDETKNITEQDDSQPRENNDWRDSVYGNIKMSVKTLDIIIGCMIGFMLMILLVGIRQGFLI